MQEHLIHGKFLASQRRVLLINWVGQAWEEISADRDMVVRGFRKCGISVAIYGLEDTDININRIEKVESDDEDPFESNAGDENDDDNSNADDSDNRLIATIIR